MGPRVRNAGHTGRPARPAGRWAVRWRCPRVAIAAARVVLWRGNALMSGELSGISEALMVRGVAQATVALLVVTTVSNGNMLFCDLFVVD